MIQWMHQQGAHSLHVGGTKAWRSDGVFHFKRLWGSKVTTLYSFIRSEWTFLLERPSPGLCDHLNQLGIITEKSGEFYSVLLENSSPSFDGAARQKAVQEAQHDGLAGICILSDHQTAFFERQGEINLEPKETGAMDGI
jgi:hypothetical protein